MKLFHRKYGDAGPPLIIVHGLYGSSDNWITIARGLSDHFEIFLVDQRNHGESPFSDQHDYPSMRDDLREFMDDQGIEKATLLGHSMGGKTVMAFAMKWPERVQALLVIDIAPVSYVELALRSHSAANHSKMIDAMLELDLNRIETREDASKMLAGKIGSQRIRQFLLKNLTRNKEGEYSWKINLPALRNSLDSIMDELPMEDLVKKGGIRGFPVVFFRGENSDYIQPEDHDTIHKLFPSAEIVSIPGAGHWVHAEQPDLLIKNLKYFLD